MTGSDENVRNRSEYNGEYFDVVDKMKLNNQVPIFNVLRRPDKVCYLYIIISLFFPSSNLEQTTQVPLFHAKCGPHCGVNGGPDMSQIIDGSFARSRNRCYKDRMPQSNGFSSIYVSIYAFSRRFYPKRLTR